MQVSLVGQWVAEAKSKLADQSVTICEYHGGQRERNVTKLSKFDVVVTTYETLASDMAGRSKSLADKEANPLPKIKWWRLVLDESHTVKDMARKQSKAVISIQVRMGFQL